MRFHAHKNTRAKKNQERSTAENKIIVGIAPTDSHHILKAQCQVKNTSPIRFGKKCLFNFFSPLSHAQ
jgi:hypothetical protein